MEKYGPVLGGLMICMMICIAIPFAETILNAINTWANNQWTSFLNWLPF